MKKTLLTFVVLFFAFGAIAQNDEITGVRIPEGYRGSLELSNGLHWDENMPATIQLSTTHGVFLNEHIYTGLGAAFEWNAQYLLVPIYANARYVFMSRSMINPFVSMRIGSYIKENMGAYGDLAIGARCATRSDLAFSIMVVGTYYSKIKYNYYESYVDALGYMHTEFVEGKTLQQLMDENPKKMDEYLNLFVDLQIKVHSHSVANLNSQKEKMQRKISQSVLDATTRYELHTRLAALPSHNKVCHGDFNPSNIIIDKKGVPHILDWAHVTSGNAAADVARTYLLFSLAGKDELAAQSLNLFCEKTDTARQYVEKWLPIVAASQSVKGKPEEKEFLLKWADVVDFE